MIDLLLDELRVMRTHDAKAGGSELEREASLRNTEQVVASLQAVLAGSAADRETAA